MGEDELEGALAVEEMSRKLRASCEDELAALSLRLGFLLERPELADEANPLSPATVCAALKDACDQLQASVKVRMTLLAQLERYMAADLLGMYHELNAHLVSKSVLPDVRHAACHGAADRHRSRAPAVPLVWLLWHAVALRAKRVSILRG